MLAQEKGQSLVEYGLIIAMVVLVAVVGLVVFGNSLLGSLYDVNVTLIANAL